MYFFYTNLLCGTTELNVNKKLNFFLSKVTLNQCYFGIEDKTKKKTGIEREQN